MAKPLGDSVVVQTPWIEAQGATKTVDVRKVIPTQTVAGEIKKSCALVKKSIADKLR